MLQRHSPPYHISSSRNVNTAIHTLHKTHVFRCWHKRIFVNPFHVVTPFTWASPPHKLIRNSNRRSKNAPGFCCLHKSSFVELFPRGHTKPSEFTMPSHLFSKKNLNFPYGVMNSPRVHTIHRISESS